MAAVDLVGTVTNTTAFVLTATIVCAAASARFVLSNRRREQAEAELQRRATQDPLTGLANRRTLEEAIERADCAGEHALVYLDLDGFQPVNDYHGHCSRDAVLLAVAERLVALAGVDTVTARVSGDEFAVLTRLPPAHAEHLTDELVRRMAEPISLGSSAVVVGASAGMVHWNGAAAASTAVHAADTVIYWAKRSGGGWRSAALTTIEAGDRANHHLVEHANVPRQHAAAPATHGAAPSRPS